MKLLPRFLALGTLLTASYSFAAAPFEGHITLAMSSSKDKDKVQTMTYGIRGQSVRIDIGGAPVSTIMKLDTHQMLILMPEQKMYMVHTISQADVPADRTGAKSGDMPTAKPDKDLDIEATGKSEVICGYKCNEFLMKDGSKVTEMWLAEGLGAYMGMGGSPGGGGMFGGRKSASSAATEKWQEALKGKGGFPLRVVTHDGSKESFKMEATKVERGGVSDEDFVPPADYKQFQMPSLGDLFKHN